MSGRVPRKTARVAFAAALVLMALGTGGGREEVVAAQSPAAFAPGQPFAPYWYPNDLLR